MSDLYPWTDREQEELKRRERRVQRNMGLCIHFTGALIYREAVNAHLNTCRGGIYMPEVFVQRRDDEPPFQPTPEMIEHGMNIPTSSSIPCNKLLNPGGVGCPNRVYLTREQAVERARDELVQLTRHRDG